MPRSLLATQTASPTGLAATFSAADASGHWFDPSAILEVVNGSGSSINVTLTTPETRAGLAVAAGARKHIAVPQSQVATYIQPVGAGQAYDGMVFVDFSAVTSVTVAAIGR